MFMKSTKKILMRIWTIQRNRILKSVGRQKIEIATMRDKEGGEGEGTDSSSVVCLNGLLLRVWHWWMRGMFLMMLGALILFDVVAILGVGSITL
jgi:hypothetical protein